MLSQLNVHTLVSWSEVQECENYLLNANSTKKTTNLFRCACQWLLFVFFTHTVQPSPLGGLPRTGRTGGCWPEGQRESGSSWSWRWTGTWHGGTRSCDAADAPCWWPLWRVLLVAQETSLRPPYCFLFLCDLAQEFDVGRCHSARLLLSAPLLSGCREEWAMLWKEEESGQRPRTTRSRSDRVRTLRRRRGEKEDRVR